MKASKTKLSGVLLIEPDVFEDQRGFFMVSYSLKKYSELEINFSFIQDNYSLSLESGVLRGLHYQLNPVAQTKLVYVITGAIYDVVVDVRRDSTTFGQWEAFILSEDNKRRLLVPRGFAHGFCTLVSNTQVQYKVDAYYSPDHERGIHWNDPELGISWPTTNPILSEKDRLLPLLKDAELNF
ncbi:dTDP-4-dehydrorhamnose 3,5-epimerase [Ammoniphilus sp. 3BR4]|uniref:dTDP-4-dehydrorhamnose 3,5-epimerase n=1 Tax=Ammoniphilus sp. 3BR4 TaxID=3158265 RepID=UPI00346643D1